MSDEKSVTAVVCSTCGGRLLVSDRVLPSREFVRDMQNLVTRGANVVHWDVSQVRASQGCNCGFLSGLQKESEKRSTIRRESRKKKETT
jgi:hypothetical protein